ncbi:MAG: cation:dicarboxylase symporter family transporter [Eubacterium sp.]|nr:cation:dicarboxylase symporter family transporter [Eubacterium sp.]
MEIKDKVRIPKPIEYRFGMKADENKYILNYESCDRIAAQIMDFCEQKKINKKNAIRYRIAAEECLLHWISCGFEGNEVAVRIGSQLFSYYLSLEMEGREINPYEKDTWEDSYYYRNILIGLELEPSFSYQNGKNRLLYRMKRRAPGQLTTLGIALALSLLIGALGQNLMTPATLKSLMDILIDPLYQSFFNVLGCVAGPMVFLSILWGINGVGDVSTFGKVGKNLILRSVRNVFLSVLPGLIWIPFFGLTISRASDKGAGLGEIIKLLLGVFPPNIVEPFITNNTLQIVFLAMVLGIVMLYLKSQTRNVSRVVGEVNVLVQHIMRVISSMVPFAIFLIMLNMIWSGKTAMLGSVWKWAVADLAGLFLLTAVFVLATSIRRKVPVFLLIRKGIPSFIVALCSASSAAAFVPSKEAFDKEYGIDSSVSGFGLPLVMVIHKPCYAINYFIQALFLAESFGMDCSVKWIITAILVCGVVAIATPPVPGGGAIALSMLFVQLNIPMEAMAIALTMDMLADFFVTAFETYCRHMTMINLASDVDMIDRSILTAE